MSVERISGRALIVVTCGALILTLSMGVRQSFGIFQVPMISTLDVGREVFAFTLALQNLLFGLFSPILGGIADRFGAMRVLIVSSMIYVAGLLLATYSTDPLELHVTLGVLVGVGLSGTTYILILGAIGRVVPPGRRSLAFGIATAMGSFGMFAVVPGAQGMLENFGWQGAFVGLAVLVAMIAGLALGMRNTGGRPAIADEATGGNQTVAGALTEAAGHSGFVLLNAAFFVCGFQLMFIAVHLPAYLQDAGLSIETAAYALALIGLFNIFGSFLFGMMGDHWRKKYLLSGLYLARAAVIALFIALPLTPLTACLFGAAIGFLWLATVPLTNGIIAGIFGTQYLSLLGGLVFLGHQVGSFMGAWLGGLAYQWTGSYDTIWLASIVLGVVAALLHLPIIDRPALRLQSAPA